MRRGARLGRGGAGVPAGAAPILGCQSSGGFTVLFRSLLRRLLLPDLDGRIEALQRQIEQQTDRGRDLEREVEALRSGQGEWLRGALDGIVADSLARPVEPDGRPRLGAFEYLQREQRLGLMDVKVLGSALGRMLFERRATEAGSAVPQAPVQAGLRSGLCRQADIEAAWLAYWAHRLRSAPFYHRKLWEDCFVLQALWEAGMLAPGRSGLGFGVGRELLPSVLAAHGVRTTATDLPAEDARAEVWSGTGQHASDIDRMFDPGIVERDAYRSLCEFRPVDMNEIPAELHGRHDFCWSVCALEHLGSIEKGLRFIEHSVRCLRPGGVAVHTTEYNLEGGGPTVDNWPTVLFQRRHIEALGERLAARGARLLEVDFDTGGGVLDGFVDLPPYAHAAPDWLSYPHAPHLRLSFGGFPVTSIGLVIIGGAAPTER